jgi:hypothetical protein
MGSITDTYKVSAKTQQVVDDYDNYVAGGFAPYPVSAPLVNKRTTEVTKIQDCTHSSPRCQRLGCRWEGIHRFPQHVLGG